MADVRKIEGLDDVLRRMHALPLEVRLKALPKAASKGAAIFRDEAKRLAPVDQAPINKEHPPGTLRKSIRVRKNRKLKPGVSVSYSAATGKAAFWADMLEFGFEHIGAGWVQVPFMRPAFESKKEQVVTGFLNELRDTVDAVGQL